MLVYLIAQQLLLWGVGRLDPKTGEPHQLVTKVTPPDRPNSVRHLCAIEMLYEFSVGIGFCVI